MYPSRQKSKASPERQESERPCLIQNLIHLHRELEPGKLNSAHSHLKLPHATCLLQGASRGIMAGLGHIHRCLHVENRGSFVESSF